jgi:hypothetical protein
MEAGQFLSDVHPLSGRGAVLEEDDGVAYLYLCRVSGQNIIGAVLAYRGSVEEPCTFHWSPDGCSVALLLGCQPIAFILDGEKVGYGRNHTQTGPMGCTWDEEKYAQAFIGI